MSSRPASCGSETEAEIRALAIEVIGTTRGADFWLAHPNAELGNQSPNELIARGRAGVIRDFLAGLSAGSYG